MPEKTTLPRASSAGWQEPDWLLLSVSTIHALLWAPSTHSASRENRIIRVYWLMNPPFLRLYNHWSCFQLSLLFLGYDDKQAVRGDCHPQKNGVALVSTWLDGHRTISHSATIPSPLSEQSSQHSRMASTQHVLGWGSGIMKVHWLNKRSL